MLKHALEEENIPNIVNNKEKSSRMNGMIYRCTNENLTKILSPIDFRDKKVLTVTASSDQPFSCMYLGAKDIDMFDSNINAYFYYYLRKWDMMYSKKYYLGANNEELIKSLDYNDGTKEEIEIAKFWKKFLEEQKSSIYYSNLFYRAIADYKVPYSDDIQKMIKILKIENPKFYNVNLFLDNDWFEKNHKYDIIILSNILEYLYELDNAYLEKSVCKKLYNMLNEGGIIVATNILEYENKKRLINEYFEYIEGEYGKSPLFSEDIPLSYTLKKK